MLFLLDNLCEFLDLLFQRVFNDGFLDFLSLLDLLSNLFGSLRSGRILNNLGFLLDLDSFLL